MWELTFRHRLLTVLFALSAVIYIPFSQWVCTTQVGTTLFLWWALIYGLALVVAILALPVLVVIILLKRDRAQAPFWLALSILVVACCVTGIVLGGRARMSGMEALARRSQGLISAIRQYQRDHSAPPACLEDLVPHYLSEVPSTGMMAYPKYRYYSGSKAAEQFGGNPWALLVFTPGAGINFDMMIYLPNQDYPERGYGGVLRPVGDWAYVHE
jgi:hypothetical protein